MTAYAAVLTRDAERDLEDLYRYIELHDSPAAADHVLDCLAELTDSLRTSPERGTAVKELRGLEISDYRQLFFKPYRVIYRTFSQQVIIYMIAHNAATCTRYWPGGFLRNYPLIRFTLHIRSVATAINPH